MFSLKVRQLSQKVRCGFQRGAKVYTFSIIHIMKRKMVLSLVSFSGIKECTERNKNNKMKVLEKFRHLFLRRAFDYETP
jgi:hypothetical protein